MEVDDIDSTQQPATTVTTGTITAVTRGGFGSSSRQQWPHSSRIIRVSRASGGKDRHSKVWTAKGPRDRRVRLSVNTAIQFYDLQDRLGYDQPSKAVEWLIKAAAEAINELPCLDSSNFPTTEAMSMTELLPNCLDTLTSSVVQQQQQVQVGGSMSKSGCSSNNSDTSKGSGLSLSRSEIRVKARERARERTTAAKEKEESSEPPPQQPPQPPPLSRVSVASIGSGGGGQSSSFTQLLTAGIDKASSTTTGPTTTSYHNSNNNNNNNNNNNVADYFGSGFMGLAGNRFGNATLPHVMSLLPFPASHEIQHQHQHHHQQSSSFLSDQHHHNQSHNQNHHLVHQVPNTTTTSSSTGGGGVSSDYNLNFSISSTSNGFNRGTLQSNSTSTSSPPPSFLSYLSGSSLPFFLGNAPISPVVVDNQQHHHHVHHYHHDQSQNHHQFNPAELQLCYGDGTGGRHSDQKGKGKN